MVQDPLSRAGTQIRGSMHSSVLLDTGVTDPGILKSSLEGPWTACLMQGAELDLGTHP